MVMKKLFLILLIFPLFVSAQMETDTTDLDSRELFDESDDWNDVGILESYIDFSKDVLSTSNFSFGIIDRQISTTLNLEFSKKSLRSNIKHAFSASINPAWGYYGVGYGISKNTEKKTTTLQTFYSTDFVFQNDFNISFINVYRTKKIGTIGYSVIASKTFWSSYKDEWEGDYIYDENGDIIDLLYPTAPASNELTLRGMLMYTYTIKTKRVNLSPQIFAMSDGYKKYKEGIDYDFGYVKNFNVDLYYGVSMDWKITKRFILNTNIRYNSNIDWDDNEMGYKKANPLLLMIGTNFKF